MLRNFRMEKKLKQAIAMGISTSLGALFCCLPVSFADAVSAPLPTGGVLEAGNLDVNGVNYYLNNSRDKNTTIGDLVNNSTISANADSVINWKEFNIAQGAVLNYELNGHGVLNRVTGGKESELLGALNSTGGTLVIANPSGIVVGPNAVINADTLMLSTMNISAAQFNSIVSGKAVKVTAGTRKNPLTKKNEYSPIEINGNGLNTVTTLLQLYGGSIKIADGVTLSLGNESQFTNAEIVAGNSVTFNQGQRTAYTANSTNTVEIGEVGGTRETGAAVFGDLNIFAGKITLNGSSVAAGVLNMQAANSVSYDLSTGILTSAADKNNLVTFNGASLGAGASVVGGAITANGLNFGGGYTSLYAGTGTGGSQKFAYKTVNRQSVPKSLTITRNTTANTNSKIILDGVNISDSDGKLDIFGGTVEVVNSNLGSEQLEIHAANKCTVTDVLTTDAVDTTTMSGTYNEVLTKTYAAGAGNFVKFADSNITAESDGKGKVELSAGAVSFGAGAEGGGINFTADSADIYAANTFTKNNEGWGSFQYNGGVFSYEPAGANPEYITYATGSGNNILLQGASVLSINGLGNFTGSSLLLKNGSLQGCDLDFRALGKMQRVVNKDKTTYMNFTAGTGNKVEIGSEAFVSGTGKVGILSGYAIFDGTNLSANNLDIKALSSGNMTNLSYKAGTGNAIILKNNASLTGSERLNILGGSVTAGTAVTKINEYKQKYLEVIGAEVSSAGNIDIIAGASAAYNETGELSTYTAGNGNKISLLGTNISTSGSDKYYSLLGGAVDLKYNTGLTGDYGEIWSLTSMTGGWDGVLAANANSKLSTMTAAEYEDVMISANRGLNISGGAMLLQNAELNAPQITIQAGTKYDYTDLSTLAAKYKSKAIFSAGTGNKITLTNTEVSADDKLQMRGGAIEINGITEYDEPQTVVSGNEMILETASSIERDREDNLILKAGSGNAITLQKAAKAEAYNTLRLAGGAINLKDSQLILNGSYGGETPDITYLLAGATVNTDKDANLLSMTNGTGNTINITNSILTSEGRTNISGGVVKITNGSIIQSRDDMNINAISGYEYSTKTIPTIGDGEPIILQDETFKAGSGNRITIEGIKPRKGDITYTFVLSGNPADETLGSNLFLRGGSLAINNTTSGVYAVGGNTTRLQFTNASYDAGIADFNDYRNGVLVYNESGKIEVRISLMPVLPIDLYPHKRLQELENDDSGD